MWPKQPPALELKNVTPAYRKQLALQDISLNAAPGEVIAVIGHNGAGKSSGICHRILAFRERYIGKDKTAAVE